VPLSALRLARNQVIFREVNERLRSLADAVPDGKTEYICECSNVHCTDKIELRLFEYEAVRARPKTFFIAPGHERPEVEHVVDRNGRYSIVEKLVPLGSVGTPVLSSAEETWAERGL
jgi:hypothetical protein